MRTSPTQSLRPGVWLLDLRGQTQLRACRGRSRPRMMCHSINGRRQQQQKRTGDKCPRRVTSQGYERHCSVAHGATVQMRDRRLCEDESRLKKPEWDRKQGAWFNSNLCFKKTRERTDMQVYIYLSPQESPSPRTSLSVGAGTGLEGSFCRAPWCIFES